MTVIKKASAGSISIHAPHEGGDGGTGIGNASRVISIHAPREGGDEAARADLVNWKLISIHAPHEGGRLPPPNNTLRILLFQSTPPTRGATFWRG